MDYAWLSHYKKHITVKLQKHLRSLVLYSKQTHSVIYHRCEKSVYHASNIVLMSKAYWLLFSKNTTCSCFYLDVFFGFVKYILPEDTHHTVSYPIHSGADEVLLGFLPDRAGADNKWMGRWYRVSLQRGCEQSVIEMTGNMFLESTSNK